MLHMRWDQHALDRHDEDALAGLDSISSIVGPAPTPGFEGVEFMEVLARSALNRVPGGGFMGGAWTINPYRGCQHACRYCFARGTHEYLGLDAGADFDSRIVVKTNIVDVLERELRGPRHDVAAVQLGTNTDPYQRAEGRYALMPGILRALAAHGASISLLTKGTLLRRDIPLLRAISDDVPVSVALSIAIFDDELQRSLEPGTPSTSARLQTVRALRDAGLDCSVFVMPVLPGLTDSDAQLDEAFASIAQAGGTAVIAGALHLRPGAKEWFAAWLRAERPALGPLYRRLYGEGSYAPREYRDALALRVRNARERHRLSPVQTTPGTGLPRAAQTGASTASA